MDRTACLWSYWHFRRQQLVYEAELVVEKNKLTSSDLMGGIKDKEKLVGYKDIIRVADSSNPLLLADWAKDFGLAWNYPKKMTDHGPSARAQVAQFREWLNNGRILISSDCRQLIACLRAQRWAKDLKGNPKDELARTEAFGHGDILMSAVYTLKFVNVNRNPIPEAHGRFGHEHIVLPQTKREDVVMQQVEDQLEGDSL